MAKHFFRCGLLVSEHGIYTREREEELIKADWVDGIYKNIWIEQFKKMSLAAYERADLVTSLYEHARSLQIELGTVASIRADWKNFRERQRRNRTRSRSGRYSG